MRLPVMKLDIIGQGVQPKVSSPACSSSIRPSLPHRGSLRTSQRSRLSAGGVLKAPRARQVSFITRAAAESDDQPPPGMSVESARQILGVNEEASFDQIMKAKNRIIMKSPDEAEMEKVDAAYDILLMQSFNRRKSGQVANKSIRYADVVKEKPAEAPVYQEWAKKASAVIPTPSVSVQVADNQDLMTEGAVFGVLALWALAQGLLGSQSEGLNVPGTQLALAFGFSLFFLRDHKRLKMSKAAMLTVGGLVAGGLVGQLFQAWLRVDILPLGNLSSPEILVSEFGILGVWAACALLG